MNIANMIRLTIVAAAIVQCTFAHSWLECTNYDPPSFEYNKLGYFDRSRCSGYPRGFARQFAEGFGIDTGYNWEHESCREAQFIASDYTDSIPMATYKAGSAIYTSHPAKNHVADTCTNAFIPSTSMVLLMSSQPEKDTFDVELLPVGGEHVDGTIDHLGFQRCYRFCDDTDKSHCILSWQLPTNIPNGRYSFQWRWEFNRGQLYSNCFDAYISNDGTTTPPTASSTSSDSSAINDTIDFPTAAPTTPAPTEDTITFPAFTPSSSPSASSTTSPTLSTSQPEVVSSAPSLRSPFVDVANYILNITGMLNVSVWQEV